MKSNHYLMIRPTGILNLDKQWSYGSYLNKKTNKKKTDLAPHRTKRNQLRNDSSQLGIICENV